jgi:hypothetical protein
MSMTLAEALAQPGSKLPAWDYMSGDHSTLRVYTVGGGGAKLLATEDIAPGEREAKAETLRERGLRIGGTYRNNPFVWVGDDKGFSVWDRDQLIADGTRTELKLPSGVVKTGDVAKVLTFYDANDRGHRGVKLQLKNGGEATVVEEHDETPRIDPTYGKDQLADDITWAWYLGQDLGNWLDVPSFDEVTEEVTNDDHRKIAAVARKLADQVEHAPATGAFEHAYLPIGKVGSSGGIEFRFAPNPLEPDQRFVELRVSSKSGKTTSGRWIKQGNNKQIASFLRQIRTPYAVLRAMNDLLDDQRQDDYA